MQVRSRPLGGLAAPSWVDQYIYEDPSKIPSVTRRYIDIEGLSAGTGYQVPIDFTALLECTRRQARPSACCLAWPCTPIRARPGHTASLFTLCNPL